MRYIAISVDITRDESAGVWVATSRDIRGLAIEGADLDEVRLNVLHAIRDLIEMNGLPRTGVISRLANRIFKNRDVGVNLSIRDQEIIPGIAAAC